MADSNLKEKIHEIIFEAETPAGKAFDVALLWLIIISILIVILDSVREFREAYGTFFTISEWAVTFIFTAEYILRLYSVKSKKSYAFSFFGIVDITSILPTYVSLLFPGSQSLLVIRALRLLRVFRVLKLARYMKESRVLVTALQASRFKITVFLGAVLTLTVIMGSLMYIVEGEESGFTSIPQGMYWSIVTLTTVGYGDIAPTTVVGKMFASTIMILGYGMLAVPTGIASVEIAKASHELDNTRACKHCSAEGHHSGAKYCYKCGEKVDTTS